MTKKEKNQTKEPDNNTEENTLLQLLQVLGDQEFILTIPLTVEGGDVDE